MKGLTCACDDELIRYMRREECWTWIGVVGVRKAVGVRVKGKGGRAVFRVFKKDICA